MKKAFLILLAAMPALLFAQTPDGYTIKGKVGTYNAPARAYLIYELAGKNVTDSTNIVNGEFKFSGTVASPISAFVVMDPTGVNLNQLRQSKDFIDATDIYIEKANIVLTSADSVSKAVITGSKLNDDNKKFKQLLAPFVARAKVIGEEYRSLSDAQQINPTYQDAIAAKYRVLQNEETEALKKFILDNSQSYIALTTMQMLIKSGMDISSIETYYNALAPAIKSTELGKGFAGAFAELRVTAIGSPAPDFTQNDVNGVPVKLASFKGKYLLIDFWASWCGPCRQENPHIARVYDHYKGQNFTILGVSLDKQEEKDKWLKAIKDDGLIWTQVSDLKYWQNEVSNLYKVSFIPQNYLIDPTGKIIAKNLKGDDLDKKLAEIFKM
ncbi:peroxiredoxin [Mucilaginibacter gracilis]|uniref:Peroxiredoxin n=1 Tax=Mucilaginibacter gracilis TaxID=423350 RepID=A0A495IY69_9SPHI|nr:TlpA disulfide reductase family protein [Mucilaginibacter gracilis]RKR81321.1 peroxiredoxin [Mucilaginibacter gracilis]